MKHLMSFLIISVFSFSAMAHHTLQEALKMFTGGHIHKKVVLVKYRDTWDPENFSKALVTSIPFKAESVFTRGKAAHQKERQRLMNYYYFHLKEAPSEIQAQEILEGLYSDPRVEFAYFQPQIRLAVMEDDFNPMSGVDLEAPTPNYESKQFYLQPAPKGVDAYYAWAVPGGTGTGIRVVDVEFGWNYSHEEFGQTFWTNQTSASDKDHGTAVWGEVAAKKSDNTGIVGISHDVNFGTAGMTWEGTWEQWFVSFERAFEQATSNMSPGHLIIIELQATGPANTYIPLEYWDPMFDVIKLATSKGIYVVEAAGNGYENLDKPVYHGAFDLNQRDSGAIMVGAGAPPMPGYMHLQKLDFSNYGKRVDVMGYGREVTTTGYGDLYGGADAKRQYTAKFSGTSSATPIVSGTVASVSGMAKAHGQLISPLEMRTALWKTGTPQTWNTSQHIGNLPNLKQLAPYFGWSAAH